MKNLIKTYWTMCRSGRRLVTRAIPSPADLNREIHMIKDEVYDHGLVMRDQRVGPEMGTAAPNPGTAQALSRSKPPANTEHRSSSTFSPSASRS